ncbi:phage tail fiber protein [Nonomuraea sediminis]|uniref:phage tail fiber protein n=1 Tax=Nonomuraea sediminis TaxID=2835864 RepID=UPI001BDCBA16|nr:hypothetical protein [Nonomuraea sediminis]
MALSNAGKNVCLDALGGVAGFVSLHTADPGTTGASEVTGGTYARKSHTWNAASSGNLDNSNQPVFDVPASTTVTHFGLWSASTSGTFYGGGSLSASESFTAAGQYTLTDCDVTLT